MKVPDLSLLDEETQIRLNDVFYNLEHDSPVALSDIYVNIPQVDVDVTMEPIIHMPEAITPCECLVIDYQDSVGIGRNPKIKVFLEGIQNIETGDFVTENFTEIKQSFEQGAQETIEANKRHK
jgi:hypothetical protein